MYDEISEGFALMTKGISKFASDICNAFASSIQYIKDLLNNKKITKKKFKKLLQSKGIQRNEINKIIGNNKEPYTYWRLYLVLGGTKD